MKIGIDTFGCEHGRSGIGMYLLSLLANLPDSSGILYELFGSEIDRYTYTAQTDRFLYTGVPVADSFAAEWIWHLFSAGSFSLKQKYSAVLFAGGVKYLPFRFKVPGIVVVNDIISELPELTSNPVFARYIRFCLSRCTKIIAGSQYIKNDLVSLSVPEDRIEVVYNGIDHSLFYPRTELYNDVVTIKPFAIKRPYLIYASRLQGPAKKHVELIRAFSAFKKATGLPHRLVLAGESGAYSDMVQKESIQSEYASDIFLTGFFPHDSLPELYANADACIFPSVCEGVGLPVIEAMACGIPVACAKFGALPEIAGKYAVYFTPDNIEETASVLKKIVTDKDLRSGLIAGGIEWTKKFDWEKTARETYEIIRKIAGQ